jgi:uncharacterized protein YjiK
MIKLNTKLLAGSTTAAMLYFSLCSFGIKGKSVPHTKFNFEKFKSVRIPEPSDIVYDKDSKHFFIVSDHGILFECDTLGNVIRKAAEEGIDFEGVEVTDSFVYVSDETPRLIYKYLKSDLSLLKTYQVSWSGAINKAFESITYNQTKKCFVLVSEAPVTIIEYDTNFKETERHKFHATRDVSGARWHNGFMYLVGNKDRTIFKCDPTTYQVLGYYNIDVLDPEGLTFDEHENVTIPSDDLQRLYFFNNLPQINNKQ